MGSQWKSAIYDLNHNNNRTPPRQQIYLKVSGPHSNPAQVANLAKCDTRLISLLTESGVAPQTMALMSEQGLHSVGMLAGIANKREDFRTRVTQFLGLDAATGAADAREVARLICAFESAQIRNEVEIRAQAERASNFLPVRVDMIEVDTAR